MHIYLKDYHGRPSCEYKIQENGQNEELFYYLELLNLVERNAPKRIIPKGKKTYKRLRSEFEQMAQAYGGRITGVLDETTAATEVHLSIPSLDLMGPSDLKILTDISANGHSLSIMLKGKDVEIEVLILYYEPYWNTDEELDELVRDIAVKAGPEFVPHIEKVKQYLKKNR